MSDDNTAFLGRGWAFPVASTTNGDSDVALVSEADDIRESLLLILQTEKGERIMRPEFGAGLRAMIYEVNNAATRTLIRHRVEEALIRWEPRVNINEVVVTTRKRPDDHILDITIGYTVRRTNTFYNLVYPFYLQERNS